MATSSQPKILAFKAGADLSAKQFCFVKFGADAETVVLCGAGEKAIGVLQNNPALGQVAEVAIMHGGAKVKSAGVIALGDLIASDANGLAVVASTSGHFIVGQAFEAGVANKVIHAELSPSLKP